MQRVLKFLHEQNFTVDTLVTDRHTQINKWLRETHPSISHYFDIWHVAKGTMIITVKQLLLGHAKLILCSIYPTNPTRLQVISIIICDRIWENPPYRYFRENFLRINFDANQPIQSTLMI